MPTAIHRSLVIFLSRVFPSGDLSFVASLGLSFVVSLAASKSLSRYDVAGVIDDRIVSEVRLTIGGFYHGLVLWHASSLELNREDWISNPDEEARPMRSTKSEESPKRPQLLLRLLPAEIESIREAASAADKTISDYVGDLHRRRSHRAPGDSEEIDALYRVLRQIMLMLGTEPPAVSKLNADLGRMSGRLKELFETDYGKAMAHQEAINETLRDVRAMRAAIDVAVGEIRAELAEPRDELVEILGAIEKRRQKRSGSE
jgi:hypothetical protein